MPRLTSCSMLIALLTACAGDPSDLQIELSPSVISSLDGRTTISAIVTDGATPLVDQPVRVSVSYRDRNGTPHDIPSIDGFSDARGVFHATIEGLMWDGVGTVTVETAAQISAAATFAVLDRTPPKLEILPPSTDRRVGPGLPLDVQVRVTDEIGISEVTLDGTGRIGGSRTTVVASGTLDATLLFRIDIPADAAPGPSVELHALASDLSGNSAAAAGLPLIVDPSITIATPPGLTGSLLVDGTAQRLVDPSAIVMSPKDGRLYVADRAGTGACNPSCIWRVDATTGVIDPTPVVVGVGDLEGVAVDATGDNLYYSDRQDRTGRLTWNGTTYANAVSCNDPNGQPPQDPYHLVFDGTLGILVADGNRNEVARVAACTNATQSTTFSINGNFDSPRGMAAGVNGEFYVSDLGDDRVSRVAVNGTVSQFETGISQPYGMEWVAGTSTWANSLMVASFDDRIVVSTKGVGPRAAAYLRNSPIDLTFATGTMFVLTAPSAGNRGRIYKVVGF